MNQWVNSNQTCIDTMHIVRGGLRVDYIFVTLILFSRSHQHFEMLKFYQNRVSACYLLNRTIESSQALCIVMLRYNKELI